MMRRALLLCTVAAAASCGPPAEHAAEAPAAVNVRTATAAMQSLPRHVEVGGVIQARATASLSSRIVAPVESIAAMAGSRVRAGQPVIRLDGRDLEAYARRAAASVTAHEQAVHAAEADRAAAEASLATVRAAHARIRQLHDARAATPREFDDAVGALRAAEAHHQAAAARVHAAESALIVSREAAEAAALTASYATVTAPFDGIVTETLVDPGDLAAPGAPLARIEDVRSLRLEVQVDEAQAAVIGHGAPVEVALGRSALDTGEETTFAGRVIEVSRSAAAGVHAFLVKVELPAEAALRTGAFARARFTAPPRQALAVPASAIVPQGQLPTVFVVASGRARMRVVRVGASGPQVEILAGLAAGEQVVTNPPPSLRDGDRVTPAQGPGGA